MEQKTGLIVGTEPGQARPHVKLFISANSAVCQSATSTGAQPEPAYASASSDPPLGDNAAGANACQPYADSRINQINAKRRIRMRMRLWMRMRLRHIVRSDFYCQAAR